MSEHAAIGGFDLDQAPDAAALEDEGIFVHIRDHEGNLMYYREVGGDEDLPVGMTVAGEYSSRYKRVREAIVTRTLKRRGAPLSGQLVGAQATEQVVGCILSWQGWARGGQLLQLTPDNAHWLLKKLPYVQPQLETAMGDHAAFFEKHSRS